MHMNRLLTGTSIARASGKLVCGLLLPLLLSIPASANTISFAQTIFDTNFVTFDVGLRDVGAGTLAVSGVTGTVTNSLLFWHGPTNSTNSNANANVDFNGAAVTGTNIGFSQDNFWSSLNSQAYRANVTSQVTGNGSYALSNFQKSTLRSTVPRFLPSTTVD
jgi:hypothetical protein